ncbi:hypothetical protein GGTG_14170 [Gaeumannomyces tritici R3-111a-1]|uniref:Uncharacterized protein n=1 Tax=Gaeumannomyces tritici (strain R3-111a-1) TaxID=644352 RepID=J3PKV0_GAET3|nr:hypothetical protein GGTG_14170 [Gaeumannomyces tritici R3-111a-1]EJT68251.1 hypothetical protein GGTG_14170 [Gaeumannomyces tritici R3-111a-1]
MVYGQCTVLQILITVTCLCARAATMIDERASTARPAPSSSRTKPTSNGPNTVALDAHMLRYLGQVVQEGLMEPCKARGTVCGGYIMIPERPSTGVHVSTPTPRDRLRRRTLALTCRDRPRRLPMLPPPSSISGPWEEAPASMDNNPRTKKQTVNQEPQPGLPPQLQPHSANVPQPPSAGPNVLPSPAPSDEPSPTAAIPQDSANQNPPSDDAPQSMERSGPAPDASHRIPVTEARTSVAAGFIDDQAQNIRRVSPARPAPMLILDTSRFQSPPVAAHAPGPSPAPVHAAFPPPPQQHMSPNGASTNTPASAAPLGPRTPGQSPQVQAGARAACYSAGSAGATMYSHSASPESQWWDYGRPPESPLDDLPVHDPKSRPLEDEVGD